MFSLLPFQGSDIEDKTKQREVENRGKLLEDELSSCIFQRLAFRAPVSDEGFSGIKLNEPAEKLTYYPQIVSLVEEALQCSFRAKHCPIMRTQATHCEVDK
jgi:hypothetical protein